MWSIGLKGGLMAHAQWCRLETAGKLLQFWPCFVWVSSWCWKMPRSGGAILRFSLSIDRLFCFCCLVLAPFSPYQAHYGRKQYPSHLNEISVWQCWSSTLIISLSLEILLRKQKHMRLPKTICLEHKKVL